MLRGHAVRKMHAGDQRVDRHGGEPVDFQHGRVVTHADHDIRIAAAAREIAGDDVELADHDFASRVPVPGLQLAGRFVEHRVHELVAIGSTVALRELDGFVDHDPGRNVRAVLELGDA